MRSCPDSKAIRSFIAFVAAMSNLVRTARNSSDLGASIMARFGESG